MAVVASYAQPDFPRFWLVADIVTLVLVVLNVLLIVAVHGRRLRQWVRGRRERAFRLRLEQILAEFDPRTARHDHAWLRRQVAGFDELERPLAAVALIERMHLPIGDEQREQALTLLREAGAIDTLVASTGGWMPWRRALAVRTLGWVGADETVPLLLGRARSDRSRSVRESAVRALGRIGDPRALPLLGELFRSPGQVGAGVVYDALVSFGRDAEPVFAGALRSEIEPVRVASCYGTARLAESETARRELAPLLADPAATVRAAAAAALGAVGGSRIPDGLARATRDEFPAVRKAATIALGSFDDPQAVELAVNALLDPDRDTAIRAGESLVRLSRLPASAGQATHALETASAWPVERALTFASLGAV
jgi:HEAT repeat protein